MRSEPLSDLTGSAAESSNVTESSVSVACSALVSARSPARCSPVWELPATLSSWLPLKSTLCSANYLKPVGIAQLVVKELHFAPSIALLLCFSACSIKAAV